MNKITLVLSLTLAFCASQNCLSQDQKLSVFDVGVAQGAIFHNQETGYLASQLTIQMPSTGSSFSMLYTILGSPVDPIFEGCIYRSMKTNATGGFIDSPKDGALRGGEKGCRTPNSSNNPDIKPNGDDKVGPDITGDDGLSVFNAEFDPRKKEVMAKVDVSKLPDGLGLSDPDDKGHQHVIPTEEMTFEDYQNKLNSIPWEKVKNDGSATDPGNVEEQEVPHGV